MHSLPRCKMETECEAVRDDDDGKLSADRLDKLDMMGLLSGCLRAAKFVLYA